MSDRLDRLTTHLSAPDPTDDRPVIQQLREDPVTIHFEATDAQSEAYVIAPTDQEGVSQAFPMLEAEDDGGWERTTIGPLVLAVRLRHRSYTIESEAHVPEVDDDG